MTTPTVVEPRRTGAIVGERRELARYSVPSGDRILYGQRIIGVVRFLPGKRDVLVLPSRPCEDDTCRPRQAVVEAACANPARRCELNRGVAMPERRVEEGS
jgi:hypothetical protein